MDKQSKREYVKPVIAKYGRVTQFTQGATRTSNDGTPGGKQP
jgi:hypothetical protein